MKCRHCHSDLPSAFLDLGFAPPSNAYLSEANLSAPEVTYPLRLRVCSTCWLVQTEDYAKAEELFDADYAYFSSTSRSWLAHAADFARTMTARFDLSPESFVLEIASNDGYLLKNFVEADIPCLGVEPTAATADAAEAIGVPVLREFFGANMGGDLARQGKCADLVAANNVFAHVPDINDFSEGLSRVLKPEGVVSLEFPHVLRLLKYTQFDTVYHEHFSYLSLATTCEILGKVGLRVFDVDELSFHGGSLRVLACRETASHAQQPSVQVILDKETTAGLNTMAPYATFQTRVEGVKNAFVQYLLDAKREGRRIAAYGAAAKGNTLLNYAGVRSDLLPFVCDAASSKQGKYLPGSHLPIFAPEMLREHAPDDIVILPWNIADEIRTQLSDLSEKGTRFVTFVPEFRVR